MLMGEELNCVTDLTRALGSAILYLRCVGTGCFVFLKALSFRKRAAVVDTQSLETESLESRMPSVSGMPL